MMAPREANKKVPPWNQGGMVCFGWGCFGSKIPPENPGMMRINAA
jgi:hypothetical protein